MGPQQTLPSHCPIAFLTSGSKETGRALGQRRGFPGTTSSRGHCWESLKGLGIQDSDSASSQLCDCGQVCFPL